MAKEGKPIKMGRNQNFGPRPKLDHPLKTFFRLMGYSYGRYPIQSLIVLCCIVFSTLAQIRGMLFRRSLPRFADERERSSRRPQKREYALL